MFNEWEPGMHEQEYVMRNRENHQGVEDKEMEEKVI
jgi:hypothetical protein